VEAKFGKYGTCKEARIVRNPMNGESRGFGFVAMKYEEARSCAGPFPPTHSCTPLFRKTRSCWCAHACTGEADSAAATAQDCDDAIKHLDGAEWNGRRLAVERARNIK